MPADRLPPLPTRHGYDREELKRTASIFLRAMHLRARSATSTEGIPARLSTWDDHRGNVYPVLEKAGEVGAVAIDPLPAVQDLTLAILRDTSILLQLQGLREVRYHTPFLVQQSVIAASLIPEGKAIPVSGGLWSRQVATPQKSATLRSRRMRCWRPRI